MAKTKKVIVSGVQEIIVNALVKHLGKKEDIEDVKVFFSGQDILNYVEEGNHIDVMIIDEKLNDMGVCEFIEQYNEKGLYSQFFALFSKLDDGIKLKNLEQIKKPFSLLDFVDSLSAKMNLYENSDEAIFEIGDFLFVQSTKQLKHKETGKKIKLTEKEVAIIRFLQRAGGKGVDRDILLNDVWGYNPSVTTHTLETHIYRLRQKIEKNPSQAEVLITDEDGGYRLIT